MNPNFWPAELLIYFQGNGIDSKEEKLTVTSMLKYLAKYLFIEVKLKTVIIITFQIFNTDARDRLNSSLRYFQMIANLKWWDSS